jgi:hypothetical protein
VKAACTVATGGWRNTVRLCALSLSTELMAERGITLTYEAVRYWCRTFGQTYANQLWHRRPRPGDTWHPDEVFLSIHGERDYLWRAVDQDGHVLDILVQRRLDTHAVKRFFRKLLNGLTYVPRVIITDTLRSYGAAKQAILPSVEHRQYQFEQPRGELPPTHPPAGAAHAGGHITGPRATLPRRPWAHRLPLPSQTSPAPCPGLPPGNAAPISGVARDDRHTAGCLKDT